MPLDNDNALIGDWNAANAGDSNNPPGGDKRNQGDDQIRRAKGTIRRHFPGFVGTWASPKVVNASEDEINTLVGISQTDPIITLPSGTPMVFYQASAPPGWTIDATVNEHSIALTSTVGGTTGGAKDFTAVFQTHAEGAADGVGDHTLTEPEIPGHTHTDTHNHFLSYNANAGNQVFSSADKWGNTAGGANYASNAGVSGANPNMVQDASGFIGSTGGDGPHGHSLDLDVRRAYCIVATKD